MRLAVIVFAFVLPAFSQFSSAGSCNDAGAIVHVGVTVPARMAAVTGAPYSEKQETGELGKSIWRDSSGRMRTEDHGAKGAREPCRSFLVAIEDPVAGFFYIVDPVNRVAHRVKLMARSAPVSTGRPIRAGEVSLGTKTMLGVAAVGTKEIRTIPPPARQPNRPTLTDTIESWRAPDLELLLYQKTTSLKNAAAPWAIANLQVLMFQVDGANVFLSESCNYQKSSDRSHQNHRDESCWKYPRVETHR